MKKFTIFTFKDEVMCFMHAMLNALDLNEKGYDVKLVLEGKSVKLPEQLIKEENPVFEKVIENGLIAEICRACSKQLGVLDYNSKLDIPLGDDLKGHPSFEKYIADGYEILIM